MNRAEAKRYGVQSIPVVCSWTAEFARIPLITTVILTISLPAVASTIVVDLGGAGDFTEIQPAIDAATDGDTVLVRAGEYLTADTIRFDKNIVLRSEAGPDETVIRRLTPPPEEEWGSVVIFLSAAHGSTLDGFTVTGGNGAGITFYPAVEAYSTHLVNCAVTGINPSRRGYYQDAAIYCTGASPEITNCTIVRNDVQGIISGDGQAEGFDRGDSTRLTACTIRSNAGAGVFWNAGRTMELIGCTINENVGPGVAMSNRSVMIVAGCTIAGNGAGGLAVNDSELNVTNSIVWDNGASIHVGDNPRFEHSEIGVSFSCIEGDPVWPGAGNINLHPRFCGWNSAEVWVSDPARFQVTLGEFRLGLASDSPCLSAGENGVDMGATATSCDVPGDTQRLVHLAAGRYDISGRNLAHHVSLEGAGESDTVVEGTVHGLRTGAELSQLTITGGHGGIVISRGQAPRILECTVSACRGTGVKCVDSSPTMTNCRVLGTRFVAQFTPRGDRVDAGSGVYCFYGSAPRLVNCAISGNDGAGVYCDNGSAPTLTNCTLAQNGTSTDPAATGGGVYCYSDSSPTVKNCIIWGNDEDAVIVVPSATPTIAYSCLDNEETWPGEGNIRSDPLFLQLGHWDRNGPGLEDEFWVPGDYRLQPSSACIDGASRQGTPTFDIDGNGRPCGAGVDMGAFETGDCPAVTTRFVRGNANSLGETDITDAIVTLTHLFLGGDEPPCLDAADADDTGVVDITDAVYLLTFLFLDGPSPEEPFPSCGLDPTIDELTCLTPSEGCR